MSFLDLKNVTKIYPNGTKAVHETSLSVDEGEFMVFVGPSGCGKSTLLRMVAGLEDITEGDINLNRRSIRQQQVPHTQHILRELRVRDGGLHKPFATLSPRQVDAAGTGFNDYMRLGRGKDSLE